MIDQGDQSERPDQSKTTMIYAFIRATLGTAGSSVLDFYVANSLWINGLLLLYALLVVFARRTFDLCQQRLVLSLKGQYGMQAEKQRPAPFLRALKNASIPWEHALSRSSFPFMTPPGSIRIYRKNLETFRRFLPLEKLVELLKES